MRAMAEIVALASAAQAFRRVTGKESYSETSSANAGEKHSIGTDAKGLKVKDILAPILTIGAGAAVGLGAAQAVNNLTGALLGSGAAILSAFALNYSSTRERTMKQELTFLPDTTTASLDRMLPGLVERIRAAGLAPIFVVDEADAEAAIGIIRRRH